MNINYGGDRDPPPAAARPGGYSSLGFQTSAGASPPAASPEEERWRAANRNELTNDLEEIEKFMRACNVDFSVDGSRLPSLVQCLININSKIQNI